MGAKGIFPEHGRGERGVESGTGSLKRGYTCSDKLNLHSIENKDYHANRKY
jgi:hypothetical protein